MFLRTLVPYSYSVPQAYKAADPSCVDIALPKPRILVIDDGDSVRDVIRIFLEHAGFEVCGEGEIVDRVIKLVF
jgi:hypothetical protein